MMVTVKYSHESVKEQPDGVLLDEYARVVSDLSSVNLSTTERTMVHRYALEVRDEIVTRMRGGN